MKKRCAIIIFLIIVALSCCLYVVIMRNTYPKDAVRSFGELPYTYDSLYYEIKGDDFAQLWMTLSGDPKSNISLSISAVPFTEAGLSYDWRYYNVISNGQSIEGFGHAFIKRNGVFTPSEALKDFIRQNRDSLLYMGDEGRYRIKFTLGAFEWAEDITATTQDIVFIVYGSTMIKNGVDPFAVEGWVYDTERNYFIKSFDIG